MLFAQYTFKPITETTVAPSFYDEEALNEVYFGLTKNVEACLDTLSEIRDKYMAKAMTSLYNYPGGCNQDPLLKRFSDELYNAFGILYDINIIQDKYPNAYTFAIYWNTMAPNVANKIYSTPNGWKVDPKIHYCSSLNITANLIFNSDYSDREVMAILLHEVGHSFVQIQDDICPVVNTMTESRLIALIATIILDLILAKPWAAYNDIKEFIYSSNWVQWFNLRLKQLGMGEPSWFAAKKDQLINNVCTYLRDFKNGLKDVFGINSLIKYISVKLYGFDRMSNKQKEKTHNNAKRGNAFNRSQEYLSDKFASEYGLGAELISALDKLGKTEFKNDGLMKKLADANPLNFYLGELAKKPYYELVMMMDAHPSNGERAKFVRENLERELNKNLHNPEVKKQLEVAIKEIDRNVEAILKLGKLKEKDPEGFAEVIEATFTRTYELTKGELKFTDDNDREKKYKDTLKEWADLIADYDPYEVLLL